jgi:hypothetical protein
MNNEPGVVSATIELDLLPPGSPGGLLSLAGSFDRVGYTKLARYLRSCADAMRAPGDQSHAHESSAAPELQQQVSLMKTRAMRAHALCNQLRIAHPNIAELGDHGSLHEAIHDVLRVDTPSARDHGVPLVLLPVLAEIERATRKFPTWPTDPLHALGVVGEEFGELGKAVLQAVYEPHKSGRDQVRDEAIQTAAMAIRFVASLDAYHYNGSAQHRQSDIANERLAVESVAGPAGC